MQPNLTFVIRSYIIVIVSRKILLENTELMCFRLVHEVTQLSWCAGEEEKGGKKTERTFQKDHHRLHIDKLG